MADGASQTRVSAVMPFHNEERFIAEAIESVLAQTHQNVELITVDDQSTDGSARIVKRYACRDNRVRLIGNPRRGAVPAFNAGVAAASGDYIHLCGADDVLAAECFAECLTAIGKSQVDVIYHDFLLVEPDLTPIRTMTMGDRFLALGVKQVLTQSVSLPSAAWLFSAEAADLAWPIPEELPFEDLWLTVSHRAHSRIGYVPEPLYYYRQHGQQTWGPQNDYSLDRFLSRRRLYAQAIPHLLNSKRLEQSIDAETRRAMTGKLEFFELLEQNSRPLTALWNSHLTMAQRCIVMSVWYWPSLLAWALYLNQKRTQNLSQKRWF